MTTRTKPSLDELRATQALLQKAHDYIEVNGFNIWAYGNRVLASGERCFIGSVRGVAGLNPCPPLDGDGRADDGDGAELTYAFGVLDDLAKKRARAQGVSLGTVVADRAPDYRIGRYVERYGIEFVDARRDEDPDKRRDEMAQEALLIFRRALARVYKQIQKAEAGS